MFLVGWFSQLLNWKKFKTGKKDEKLLHQLAVQTKHKKLWLKVFHDITDFLIHLNRINKSWPCEKDAIEAGWNFQEDIFMMKENFWKTTHFSGQNKCYYNPL